MNQLTRVVAASVAAGFAIASAVVQPGTAVAQSGGRVVPLSYILRSCDGTANPFTPSSGHGTAYAIVSSTGSTVTAEVATARPGR